MQAVLFLCKFCRLFIALCLPVCIKNDQYFWSHTVPLFICKRVFTRNAFTSAEGSVRDLLPNCDQKSSIKCSFVKFRAAHHCQQENLVLEIFMRCNVLQQKQTSFFFFFSPPCSTCKLYRKISTQEKFIFHSLLPRCQDSVSAPPSPRR